MAKMFKLKQLLQLQSLMKTQMHLLPCTAFSRPLLFCLSYQQEQDLKGARSIVFFWCSRIKIYVI